MEASKGCDSVVSTRLKREDCKRTKHDSAFSQWKVLIGPSDWEDHSLGKEAAERYRVHNLPNCSSCSGLYELGIVLPCTRSGHETAKPDPDHVIPVYIGQADNVRTRLQRYGREGAHLENVKSIGESTSSVPEGPGLFSEIFSRGYSIVYRWAPMKSKRDAEKTETRLLDTFDYAWNKGSNGFRRPNDILQKLDRATSRTTGFATITGKFQVFHQKKWGIKIEACKQFPLEKGFGSCSTEEKIVIITRILKIGRLQPRLISSKYDFNEHHASICGVALGHGSVCRRPPIEGRKRCAEHKGMKVNGFTSKLITERKSTIDDVITESGVISNPECDGHQLVSGNCPFGKVSFPICRVALDDGSLCRRQPVQGRKRCEEHKGRKITRCFSKSLKESKQHDYVLDPVLESSWVSYETHKSHKLQCSSERSVINKMENTCGVDLGGGTFCERPPVVGRKRCKEHKGMRVTESSWVSYETHESHKLQCSSERSVINKMENTCGVDLGGGTFCERPPVVGRKRCKEHKGMRVTGSNFQF